MGKKGSSTNNKGPIATASSHSASITLREESSGKKQRSVSAKSMLKMDHIKNLAIWAGGEASILSLGALFGHRLAATAEALDIAPDPSLFYCQRCESILQPGYNCTVRIEKNKTKARHRNKKSNLATQNNVAYRCHFCSHQNLRRGTPKCYMKDLCPPKAKPASISDPLKLTLQKASTPEVVTESKNNTVNKHNALPETVSDSPMIHAPLTPVTTAGLSLLDSKRRKRTRPGTKKAFESGGGYAAPDAENATGASSKRKRKSWTSLKEIAEHDEQLLFCFCCRQSNRNRDGKTTEGNEICRLVLEDSASFSHDRRFNGIVHDQNWFLYDKVTVLESEKRAWESSAEAQAIREALNPWRQHDQKQEKVPRPS